MEKKELVTLCKEYKIKGISGKTKDELIMMIVVDSTVPKIEAKIEESEDTYTIQVLKEQYILHQTYIKGRMSTTKGIGLKVRLACIPEDISENIIKHIIHNKLGDKSSRWDCKKGDLHSKKEGIQECKCFTSDGPLSFTPSSDWDVIYFLDARKWSNNIFTLYRIPLKRSSLTWKNIKVNKSQTFEDQSKQGRRPRLTWESLFPQIELHCTKVYEGVFEDIFIPLVATE
jgi:hypothetical protein